MCHSPFNPTNSPHKGFSTSLSDFALPVVGTSASLAALPSPSLSASSSPVRSILTSASNSHGFPAAAAPISIPSTPSRSTSVNRSSLFSLSPSKFSPRHGLFPQHSPIGLGVSTSSGSTAVGIHCAKDVFSTSPSLNDTWSFSASISSASSIFRRSGQPFPVTANPTSRLRRSSMLGREITPFDLDQDDKKPDHTQQPVDTTKPFYAPTAHANPFQLQESVSIHHGHLHSDLTLQDDDQDIQMDDQDGPTSALFSLPSSSVQSWPAMTTVLPPSTPPWRQHQKQAANASLSESGIDAVTTVAATGFTELTKASSGSPGFPTPSSGGALGSRSRSGSMVASGRSSTLVGGVIRKSVNHRRGNLMPRDRSVLRVAANLLDEKRPQDCEIAAEAKLQKGMGGDPTVPRTPRLSGIGGAGGGRIRSPHLNGARQISAAAFAAANGRAPVFASMANRIGGTAGGRRRWMWDNDDDDEIAMFDGDGLDNGGDGYTSSEDEMVTTSYTEAVSMHGQESEEETEMQDDNKGSNASTTASGSGGVSESMTGSLPKNRKGTLWMGFREMKPYHHPHHHHHHKSSPSQDRLLKSRGYGPTSATNTVAPASIGFGHGLPMDMETSPITALLPTNLGGSPGPWSRAGKRKTFGGEERYEPYATSAYKRRAVSPMTLLNSATAAGGGSVGSLGSPSLLGSNGNGGTGNMTLPTPTPISMPSPTSCFSTFAGSTVSYSQYRPSQLGNNSNVNGTGSGSGSGSGHTGGPVTPSVGHSLPPPEPIFSSRQPTISRPASPLLSISQPTTPRYRTVTAFGILNSVASAATSSATVSNVHHGDVHRSPTSTGSYPLLSNSFPSSIPITTLTACLPSGSASGNNGSGGALGLTIHNPSIPPASISSGLLSLPSTTSPPQRRSEFDGNQMDQAVQMLGLTE